MEQFQLLFSSLSSGDVSTIMSAIAGMGMIFIIIMVLFSLVVLAIEIVLLVYLFSVLKKIPKEFRKMEPGLVFLLLIPCFSLVWMFFVLIRISESLKAYFDSKNNQTVGDCGKQLGLWTAICFAASLMGFIPLIGQIPPVVGLVLLIIYIVKVNGLKNLIKD